MSSVITGTQNLDYFNVKAISNSLMGVYLNDFDDFVNYWVRGGKLKRKTDDSLTFGTICDLMLTRPEEFNDRVLIYDGVAPTGQTLKFIQEVAKTSNCNFEVAYEVVKAQNKGKLRDSIDKFKEGFEANKKYYETLLAADKIVISQLVINRAQERISELKSNPYTRLLTNIESSDNIEVINQLELFTVIDGLNCKGAPDKVVIDHKKKRIMLIDYKTSANSFGFVHSVKEYGYYRQGSFYKTLILPWMQGKGIEDYEITDFLFIVISSTYANRHFIARLNDNDCKVGELGGTYKSGYKVKGWREILGEINFMTKEGNWNYPYDIQINNGIMELDIFNQIEENGE